MRKVDKIHIDETGSPFFKENRVELDQLGDKSHVKLVYQAIDYFKDGMSRKNVAKKLRDHRSDLKDSTLEELTKIAAEIIASEYLKKDETVIGIHLERYNDDILHLENEIRKGFKNYDAKLRRAMTIGAYSDILALMFQKEGLLRLHSKSVIVRINQQNNITVKIKKEKFDISKLNLEEQIELLALMQKSKRTESEVAGVILNKNVQQENTIDIEHEVIQEPNVNKIKLEDPKPEEKEKTYSALSEVHEKMRAALKLLAEKQFKEAGSKTIQNEN